jgi:hypothetical protein
MKPQNPQPAEQHSGGALGSEVSRSDEPLFKDQVQKVNVSSRQPTHSTSPWMRTRRLRQEPLYKDQVRDSGQKKESSPRLDGHHTSKKSQAGIECADSTAGESITENNDISRNGIEDLQRNSNGAAESDALVAELVVEAYLPVMAVAVDNTQAEACTKRRILFSIVVIFLLACVVVPLSFATRKNSSTEPLHVPIAGCIDALPLIVGKIVNVSNVNATVANALAFGFGTNRRKTRHGFASQPV